MTSSLEDGYLFKSIAASLLVVADNQLGGRTKADRRLQRLAKRWFEQATAGEGSYVERLEAEVDRLEEKVARLHDHETTTTMHLEHKEYQVLFDLYAAAYKVRSGEVASDVFDAALGQATDAMGNPDA